EDCKACLTATMPTTSGPIIRPVSSPLVSSGRNSMKLLYMGSMAGWTGGAPEARRNSRASAVPAASAASEATASSLVRVFILCPPAAGLPDRTLLVSSLEPLCAVLWLESEQAACVLLEDQRTN